MKREIVLDTETTGLNYLTDRVIEIGCVELVDGIITGNSFHSYCHPERDIPYGATRVHGITIDMLSDAPLFFNIAVDLLNFIGNDTLIIHNAEFDKKFLNMELERAGYAALTNPIVDTLIMARKQFSGSPASLNALCKRFSISLKGRSVHGAKIDAELLARVYIEMTGGIQMRMLSVQHKANHNSDHIKMQPRGFTRSRHFKITDKEKKAHEAFIKSGRIKNPLWNFMV